VGTLCSLAGVTLAFQAMEIYLARFPYCGGTTAGTTVALPDGCVLVVIAARIRRKTMIRGLILWLLGVPLVVIILLWLFGTI
jgi:hypothetical protein